MSEMLDDVLSPDSLRRRIVIELTNICNLHCSYCLRDELALYQIPAHFFSLSLLERILREARDSAGVAEVSFTGGEPSLHPQFEQVLATVEALGLRAGFVTNGWHFERIWAAIQKHRAAVSVVAFSIDGPTRETHDHWRGTGSFDRVIRAMTRCHMSGVPFILKAVIRRDSVAQLEPTALFAARLGAAGLHFSHVMPTSAEIEDSSAMTLAERAHAEQEIAILNRILSIPVRIDVGYANLDPAPPCGPLQGMTFSVDYKARMTICCNMSGFRGAGGDADVLADLTTVPFASAVEEMQRVATLQVQRRATALTQSGSAADLTVSSPCLFCLKTFDKTPWIPENR
jgi:sulfatase maturation enzyme AslB (radical SAM superfamily)